MTDPREPWLLMQTRYSMDILLAVADAPASPVTRTQILEATEGDRKTRLLRIEDLVDAGLLEIDGTRDAPRAVCLTPKGAKAVIFIRKLKGVVQ